MPISRINASIRGVRMTGAWALTGSGDLLGGCSDYTCDSRITSFLGANAGESAQPDPLADPSTWPAALSHRVLVYREDETGNMRLTPFPAGPPPDNRTVVDLIGGSLDFVITAMGPIVFTKIVLAVTAEPQEQPWARAGSAIWRYDARYIFTGEDVGQWRLLKELPCYISSTGIGSLSTPSASASAAASARPASATSTPSASAVDPRVCDQLWYSVDFNRMALRGVNLNVQSATPSASQSPTPSPSASPSPAAFRLLADVIQPLAGGNGGMGNAAACAASAAATASLSTSTVSATSGSAGSCVSPGLPAVPVRLSVRGCSSGLPAAAELSCTSSEPRLVRVLPARRQVTCPAAADITALVPLGVDLTLTAAPPAQASDFSLDFIAARARLHDVTVRCTLRRAAGAFVGASADSATAEITASWLPYQWPLWDDLVLYYSANDLLLSPRTGISASGLGGAAARAGTPVAVEAALRRFIISLPSTSSSIGSTGIGGFAATVSQAARGTLVARGATRLWAAASNASTAAQVRSIGDRVGPFDPNTTSLLLGGVTPLRVLWVSSDGTLLHFQIPRAECAASGSGDGSAGACGYRSLTVRVAGLPSRITGTANGAASVSGASSASSPSSPSSPSSSPSPPLNLTCPPACPGLPPLAFPAVALGSTFPSSMASALLQLPPDEEEDALYLLPWSYQRTAAAAAAVAASGSSSSSSSATSGASSSSSSLQLSSSGLYFAPACPGFTDPSLEGACTNTSHPAFTDPGCAFGDGIVQPCVRCPAGALCPGGARGESNTHPCHCPAWRIYRPLEALLLIHVP